MDDQVATRGIVGFGCYVPRRLITGDVIAGANAWANPALRSFRGCSRTYCAVDEDPITMAVAAAQSALRQPESVAVDNLVLGSTTLPFSVRQNAGIVAEALGLGPDLQVSDVTGSRKLGTSMLLQAVASAPQTVLLVAADSPAAKSASLQEVTYGHGAVALLVGDSDVMARVIGAHSTSVDFIDHYRLRDEPFDYGAEPRWIRDEGHTKLIPSAIRHAMAQAGIEAGTVNHLVIAGVDSGTQAHLAKSCGIDPGRLAPDCGRQTGMLGAAHGLALLAATLQVAEQGDIIVVAEFGQGCNALVIECTDAVRRARQQPGFARLVDRARKETNYHRFLSQTGGVELDWGRRAEKDNRTAQSAYHRARETVSGFVGGRCGKCGSLQYPKSRSCANPDCRAIDEQAPESLRECAGQVKSYTEDWLAYCPDPPLKYGNVRFRDGAVVMMEFADFAPGELAVGLPVMPQFRIKDRDEIRGFVRYCWKAVPVEPAAAETTE